MEIATIKAEPRTTRGTRLAAKLRSEGLMPGIIYGHGAEPVKITLKQHDVDVALAHGARAAEVEVAGEKAHCFIKEVQWDHLGDHLIHIDFARVDLTEKVQVKVAIQFKGDPKGVSAGGVLDQLMADIEVECTLNKIPESLPIIISGLGIGDSLQVKDLPLPDGVTALADPEQKVVIVHAGVEADETEEEIDEEGAGDAEPEVIGRKRKEEGEE